MIRTRGALSALFMLFATATALAAQDAMVTAQEAPIRERPQLDATIIETKNAGAKIRISQFHKEGWYKTRASTGQYGWIWQADISILSYTDDVKTANLEQVVKEHEHRRTKEDHWIYLRAGGFLLGAMPGDLNEKFSRPAAAMFWAPGGFGEISFKLVKDLRLAFRVAGYSTTSSVSDNRGVPYDVSISGTPFLVGIDKDISVFKNFYLSAGLYGGYSFGNQVSVTATTFEQPNSFTIKKGAPAALLNFAAQYYLADWFSVIAEAGFYYSYISNTRVPPFNGDTPFKNPSTGNNVSLYMSHMGPMLGAAVQFNL